MSPKTRKAGKADAEQNTVKTTLVLPHELWVAARTRAAEERTDLKTLLIEGLKLRLRDRQGR
jgi:hypothetical protein